MSLTRRVYADRRKVMLPLLVFLIVNLAVVGVVFYLESDVDAAEAARQQAILDLGTAKKAETDAKAQRISKERADVELRTFYSDVLPKNLASAVSVTNFWLGRIAAESRLAFRVGNYDHEQVRGSQLTKVTGEIKLTGEYADVRRFLYDVETAEEFVIIEKVELSQPNTVQGSSQLELSLSIATYYLTEQPGVVRR